MGWASRLVLALPLMLALGSQSAAALVTRGAPTCSEWLSDAKLERQAETWRVTADHFWLLGYISGLSVATGIDILKDTDNDVLYQWMDKYCDAHVFRNLNEAADEYARTAIKEGQPERKP